MEVAQERNFLYRWLEGMIIINYHEWRQTFRICLHADFQINEQWSKIRSVDYNPTIGKKKIGTASLTVYFDYQLLINKVKGEYAAKGKKLKMYLKEAKALMERFSDFQIEVNPRESNSNILISNGNTSWSHIYIVC